jgi:regulator of protease activity HflC (stomatin/prohibitin superfamily)
MKKLSSIFIMLAFAFLTGCTTIDETERGVVLEFGKYSETFDPGLHFYNVFTKEVVEIPVRTQLETLRLESGSKDLQTVSVEVNVNYHVDPMNVGKLYSKYGKAYVSTILQPKIKETITGVTPQYVPEEMLQKREEIRARMETALKSKLDSANANIVIDGFTITSFSFSQAFDRAIEEKQVAEQQALKEKNILKQIEYQNDQKVAKARADSTEMAIKMATLKSQSGKEYLMLKWIEKWNGELPKFTSDNKIIPMLNGF